MKNGSFRESADFLSGQIKQKPDIALILGSGLGFMSGLCEDAVTIPYKDIPNFPLSTAPGHRGELVFGSLGGKNTAVMSGRFHYYEGYSLESAVFGLRVLRLLGASVLIVTNASGGIREDLFPGDIMMISDHINLTGNSPLRGENIEELGVRFPDMTEIYTKSLREKAMAAALRNDIELKEGVYMYFAGPQYETPAEIRAAKSLGADAVGMSTVPEAVAARHAGMKVLGFSLVCNKAAGLSRGELSESEVLENAEKAKEKFSKLILACLEAF